MKQLAEIRVRFAPSPTGAMHLGNVRTMLFQVLFARHEHGTFILRLEDTDQDRLVAGATENILESMRWLGIEPDEGLMLAGQGQIKEKGEFGPYQQSQRKDIYQKYAEQLIAEGKAYYCFATEEELAEMRATQQAKKQPPRYDGRGRHSDPEEAKQRVAANEPHVIRFKMPEEGEVTGHDQVYGEIKFNYREFDDHVIIKSDGLPTYHFASVVDDHLMEISHVFRGEEWISSWPRHLATYVAFGWAPPIFVQLPLIFGTDHQKLSKRHGAKTILEYRDEGFLPEALINYLVFLGWNPKTTQELFLWDELVAAFDVAGINKANPIFDQAKLEHLNGVYLRELAVETIVERAMPWLVRAEIPQDDQEKLTRAVASVQERAHTLAEIPALIKFYFVAPTPDQNLIRFKEQSPADCARLLDWAAAGLEKVEEWTEENIQSALRERIAEADVSAGEMLWPVRAALTGEKASPGAFEVAYVLGQEETVKRLRATFPA